MYDNATPGDRLIVEGPVVDRSRRHGEVLEVLGEGEAKRYRVRWDDGAESIYMPGPDARVERPQA